MEDWKDDILNSMKGDPKVTPSPDAFDQILSRIHTQKKTIENGRGWMAIAASISIILVLNMFIINKHLSKNDSGAKNQSGYFVPTVTDYNIYNNE